MSLRGHQPDYGLIIGAGGLLLFGLIVLSSAGAPLGYQKFGDPYYFLKHQLLIGVIPGLIACYFLSRFSYTKLRALAFPMLLASLGLLLLVFIPGLAADYGTSRSWVSIAGMSFQPAELVKLTFLIYLAAWLTGRGERQVQDVRSGLLPFAVTLGAICLLMLLQPDVGTLSIIVGSALVVYFVGGGNLWHLASLGGVGVVGLLVLVKIAPYRMNRFTAFLHPERDPQGIAYHIWQSLIAVGSGGWVGVGLGRSRQKFSYLPEVTGDSIFAVMAEEIGFVFSALFVIALLVFIGRCIRLARQAPDRFSQLLVIGIVAWIGLQSLINIGAMLALLPITGVPLPFVSAGGTALFTTLAAVGIMINISRFSK